MSGGSFRPTGSGSPIPTFSPDGRSLAYLQETLGDWDSAPRRTLQVLDLATDEAREVLPGDTVAWPSHPVFSPDGAFLYFLADEGGRAPVFRLDLGSGAVLRLTASGSYTDLVVSPDGSALFALGSAVDSPPTPVRLDPTQEIQEAVTLLGPQSEVPVPGTLTEVLTTAEDGTPLRAWLALPSKAGADAPAPLLLWIHGGPVSSWNGWSWRWNPWLMVARGYAVLLPDPALSTGYGHAFLQRGWGRWGGRPFTDLMTMTDAAVERPEIDRSRVAAMGGSFGGYMANWVATQTDRFRAIVTHASLWAPRRVRRDDRRALLLAQGVRRPAAKAGTVPGELPAPARRGHPHPDAGHPRRQGLPGPHRRGPAALVRPGGGSSVPAKFLYFPDENHWILTPGHVKVWYETVSAFLAEHVLGEQWRRPDLL